MSYKSLRQETPLLISGLDKKFLIGVKNEVHVEYIFL